MLAAKLESSPVAHSVAGMEAVQANISKLFSCPIVFQGCKFLGNSGMDYKLAMIFA